MTDDSDSIRKDIQILTETIDRNLDRDWEEYRERHEFTIVSDGRVLVSSSDDEHDVEYEVRIDEAGAVDCDCYVASRPTGGDSCRHMRAVDAHPRL